MGSEKRKVLSLTREHFEFQFFRAGGKGGQKQNKTSSACRCIHTPSGAVGESREERSQVINRRRAFRRCVETPAFQTWLRIQTSKAEREIEDAVERAMAPQNLLVEYGV